jgi:hypothetical protein
MPPRIQLPADFKPWRFVCLGCGAGLIALGMGILLKISPEAGIAAAGPAALGLSCFIAAAVFIAPQIVGVIARPLTGWLDEIFCPTETIRQPPADLLRAIRQRLRDRFWESVDQQTLALIDAYGPSAELYHLRAHLAAGRDGNYCPVTAAAATTLSARAFDRYLALLRRDPPPAEIRLGLDA